MSKLQEYVNQDIDAMIEILQRCKEDPLFKSTGEANNAAIRRNRSRLLETRRLAKQLRDAIIEWKHG